MNKYNITLSKVFLKGHPRSGEPTGFKQAYLDRIKIHTIRVNYDYWANVLDEVIAGRAVLQVQEWTGTPYASKMELIEVLDASSGLGYQQIFASVDWTLHASIDDKYSYETVALIKNDALKEKDFMDWFFPNPNKKNSVAGIIIHFTKFRY